MLLFKNATQSFNNYIFTVEVKGWRMVFLNFMKKREELPTDIDLDIPPEPPKMMEEDVPIEEPIDEELMPKAKSKKVKEKALKAKKRELPELPPLPKMEEEELSALPEEEEFGKLPELPPLPEEKSEELGELDLPPPPEIKNEKRGFFSFLKPKKAAKELGLPRIEEEIPEMPTFPEVSEEFPEIPPLSKEKEIPTIPQSVEPLKPVAEKPMPEIKEIKPVKKFVTINDFRQIQSDIGGTKDILKGVDGIFSKLEEVKNIGDKEYVELRNGLQDIQRKIMFVDKVLFKEVQLEW